MKIKETTTKQFISDDGSVFDNETACYMYEMFKAKKEIGESPKYVLGHINADGTGYFDKYKKRVWKNGKTHWSNTGGTSNVKYAYKFDSFEDAYSVGGNYVVTLEEAKKATEIYLANEVKRKKVEQRYVCEFDREPGEDGEYITNLGMMEFQGEWAFTKVEPTFWMKKVNLTAR